MIMYKDHHFPTRCLVLLDKPPFYQHGVVASAVQLGL